MLHNHIDLGSCVHGHSARRRSPLLLLLLMMMMVFVLNQSLGVYLGKVIACRMLGFTLFSSTSSMVAASGTAINGLRQRRQVQRHGQQGQHGDRARCKHDVQLSAEGCDLLHLKRQHTSCCCCQLQNTYR
jgi:MFS superfamily sulfate permease-like transporter